MALVYKALSPDLVYIRYLNVVLGVLTCWLVARFTRELAGRRAGLAACLLAAAYEPFLLESVVPLKTALFLALFALGLWLLARVLAAPSWGKALGLGIVAALMLNVAGQALPLIPVFALAAALAGAPESRTLRKGLARLLAYGAGVFLVVAPVALRNHRAGGEWVLTTSQGGFNLYLGNRLDHPEPYYVPVPFASPSPFEQGIQFTVEASRRTGRRLTAAEASRYWTSEVVRLAAEEPAGMARKLGLKGLALLSAYERADHYDLDFLGRFARFFALPLPGWGLLLPLGIAGMVGEASRSRLGRWMIAVFWAYAATLVLFFTNTRYRTPLALLLIPFAILGAQALLRAVRQRETARALVLLGAAGAALVLELLPFPGAGDQTAAYNTHALILDSRSRTAEAVESWRESSRRKGTFSPFADLALAGKRLEAGDFGAGLRFLDRIPDGSFAAAFKYEVLGDVLALRGEPGKAVAAYERSIAVNGGRPRPREKLVRLLEKTAPRRAAEERAALERVRSYSASP